MKTTQRYFIAASLSLGLLSPAAIAGGNHDHSPKHGGIVHAGKTMDTELVTKPGTVSLYLRGDDKPRSVNGASAKMTILAAGAKTEVELKPVADGSRLEATGNYKWDKGTKVVAVITTSDKKTSSVNFTLK